MTNKELFNFMMKHGLGGLIAGAIVGNLLGYFLTR